MRNWFGLFLSGPLQSCRAWGIVAFLIVSLAGVQEGTATATSRHTLQRADSISAQAVAFSLRYGTEPLPTDSPDRWWARDKARHVVFSALWTLSTQYVLVSKTDWSEGDALPVSIGSAAAVGLAKELYDRRGPEGRMSGKDLVADAVGIGLAVGLISL